jgi:hypothetical protein
MTTRKKGRRANFDSEAVTVESEVEYLNRLLKEAADRIDAAYEAGNLTEAQAEELEVQAEEDYEERIQALEEAYAAGEIESEAQGEEEDADYADGTTLATFASATATRTGQALLELGAERGYEYVEDLVEDLADYTGLSDEDITGLLTGEYVPDDELAQTLAQGFEVDDETADEFYALVEEDLGSLGGEGEGDANYSAYAAEVEELRSQVAEFQTTSAVNGALLDLERRARQGVDEGWLPPIAKEAILGNFELAEDRVASFSQLCVVNKTTPEVELYAIEKQLAVFEAMGPIYGNFNAMVKEPLTEAEFRKGEEVSTQAKRNHEARKKSKRFRDTSPELKGLIKPAE